MPRLHDEGSAAVAAADPARQLDDAALRQRPRRRCSDRDGMRRRHAGRGDRQGAAAGEAEGDPGRAARRRGRGQLPGPAHPRRARGGAPGRRPASKATTIASKFWPPIVTDVARCRPRRARSSPRASDDTKKPLPTASPRRSRWPLMRAVLASADCGQGTASASAGRSTGAAGSGSRPAKSGADRSCRGGPGSALRRSGGGSRSVVSRSATESRASCRATGRCPSPRCRRAARRAGRCAPRPPPRHRMHRTVGRDLEAHG